MGNSWHTRAISELFAEFDSHLGGLTEKEAARRLAQFGKNELPAPRPPGFLRIFVEQFRSPFIYILAFAALLIAFLGDTTDASVIAFVLLLNAVIGAVQEGRAQDALGALKRFAETITTVLRDGNEQGLRDVFVVPGDVIVLRSGEKIPADARLISGTVLLVDEAAITGESEPSLKSPDPLMGENMPLGDRKNMLFKGTYILSGTASALVVATGERTIVGRISSRIASHEAEIPLKVEVRRLTRTLILIFGIVSALLFAFGIGTGRDPLEMLALVVSLSVAVIPEGLPVVMTVVLSTGVYRMAKRNAIVKKLQAVEALGQARIIALDKTGTLTKNEMMVRAAYADGVEYQIDGTGYDREGRISKNGFPIDTQHAPALIRLAKAALSTSDTRVTYLVEEKRFQVLGDPTEAALVVFAQKLGFSRDILDSEESNAGELPFDARFHYHAVVKKTHADKYALFVTGAPEVVLMRSERIAAASGDREIEERDRHSLERLFEDFSERGLRTIACGTKELGSDFSGTLSEVDVSSLTFLGFVGIEDPLRPEAQDAVRKVLGAGMRVVMITGDRPATARSIAQKAGIPVQDGGVVTGEEVDRLSPSELRDRVGTASVFARVNPDHKLLIIEAFRARGEIVAMTGDGVNDAPSLIAADLGVAMGNIGTEIAKESADIVLLDDNFGTIVAAVEEGRGIYRSMQRVTMYLLSTGAGEFLTISAALLAGYPAPLLPAQIIWLNLVTDSFLDVSLGMEPRGPGLLGPAFERRAGYLLTGAMIHRMGIMALAMTAGTMLLFIFYSGEGFLKAGTIALTTLAVFQWYNAWNCRDDRRSVFQMNPFSNPYLVAATAIVVCLQLLAVYHPVLQRLLHTTPLTLAEWLVIGSCAGSIIIAEEIRKYCVRVRDMKPAHVR